MRVLLSGHVRVCVCTSNRLLNNSVLFKSDTNTKNWKHHGVHFDFLPILVVIIIIIIIASASPPSLYTILLHSSNCMPYMKLFTLWAGFVHRLLLPTTIIIRVQNINTKSRLVLGPTLRRTQWVPPFFRVTKAAGAWR